MHKLSSTMLTHAAWCTFIISCCTDLSKASVFAQAVACCAAAACRALQYDPTNRFAAYGIFSGMGIMALSLLLLGLL
jgi:hypothetical protein